MVEDITLVMELSSSAHSGTEARRQEVDGLGRSERPLRCRREVGAARGPTAQWSHTVAGVADGPPAPLLLASSVAPGARGEQRGAELANLRGG